MAYRSNAFAERGPGTLRGKKVMVTGGAGFIGSHLCEAIAQEEPAQLAIVDNLFLGKEENIKHLLAAPRITFHCEDLSNQGAGILALFKKTKYDVVFNLAVCPLPHSLEAPAQNVDTNIRIVLNLCALQRQGKFDALVHFSSSEAYGSKKKETSMDENHPLGPSTPYAAAKAAADLIVLSFARTFGTKAAILRPFNTYGERQNEGSYAGIIPSTIQRIMSRDNPVIYGDGNQSRDYTYVGDVAEAACQVYRRFNLTKGLITNIGSGRETNIAVLVLLISSLMEEEGYQEQKVKYQAARPGDVRRHIANVYQAEDLLGYDPDRIMPLTAGLKKTIRWYTRNDKRKGKK